MGVIKWLFVCLGVCIFFVCFVYQMVFAVKACTEIALLLFLLIADICQNVTYAINRCTIEITLG